MNRNPGTFSSRIIVCIIMLTLVLSAGLSKTHAGETDSLDRFYSEKQLGCTVSKSGTTFRLFAPRASKVTLVLYQRHDDAKGEEIHMVRDENGVWEYTSLGQLTGKYYGYRVDGPADKGEMFNPDVVIADPYSKAVATKNSYRHEARTLILDTQYDWRGDTFVTPSNHNELIIYEAHVRDLTAHPSSGVRSAGTYFGLTEKGKTGGLSYLKDLGVNAVELLPVQDFGNIEIPYRDPSVVSDTGEVNTWNPYERNHWGYMTSYFFAPESYYATGGTMARSEWNGIDGRAVKELKDLVKTLHREQIAVILDVVYNHVSQYDYNPFKYIDKFYYFRCDTAGRFLRTSGCGNDFKTERAMARRLIVESVEYWMREYRVDGFRFDLATMLDWETIDAVAKAARKINPNVILIAEAWGGGGYDLAGFSDHGWAAWNDLIRNGVKGQNPHDGLGFIFGTFQGSNTKRSLQAYVTGSLREDGGPFLRKEHSLNYLESHDDHTLGDFIRIGSGEVKENDPVFDMDRHVTLSPRQMALNKLAALYLFTAQGPVMIHEGQEYARSKVIAPTDVPDPRVRMIDHNSYDKDNETNWLNYRHRDLNRGLYDYYRGLIALRKDNPILSSAPKDAVTFLETDNDFHIAFRVDAKVSAGLSKHRSFIVVLNGNPELPATIALPKGKWSVVADQHLVSPAKAISAATKEVVVPPTSGMILRQE
jgi:pullulanase